MRTHILHHSITRAGQRQARGGSVLIIVVVLLVLMALLGTAFLVTARNDLASSTIYEHNVQIGLLLQGVENMSQAVLTDSSYQAAPTLTGPTGAAAMYQHYDDWFSLVTSSPINGGFIDHSWLASRFPTALNDPTGGGSAIGLLPASGPPLYPVPKGAVCQVGTGTTSLYLSLVDNNTATTSTTANWATIPFNGLGGATAAGVGGPTTGYGAANITPCWPAVSGPLLTSCRNEDPRSPALNIRPDGVRTVVVPTVINILGTNYPALTYYSTINQQIETALAASATGNGIADSFLWRLPVGSIDGVTWYAAVRIVDNNSAINANTANSSTTDWTYKGDADGGVAGSALTTPNSSGFFPGIFPSGIGLLETTYSWTLPGMAANVTSDADDAQHHFAEMTALNNIRFGGYAHPTGIQGGTIAPIDDSFTYHKDMMFRNVGDALWMQLGRRINNPGYFATGPSIPPPPVQYGALSWTDSTQLAYRGDLANPNASPSTLECCLVRSLYNRGGTPGAVNPLLNFQHLPWDPTQTAYWAAGYQINAGSYNLYTYNRRAYFVARNPTNNCMPAHSLTWTTTGLSDADLQMLQARMIGPNYSASIPSKPDKNTVYNLTTMPRVSLNTADVIATVNSTHPTLWFGFYNAMLDALQQPISLGGQTIMNVAQGYGPFRSPLRDVNMDTNYNPLTIGGWENGASPGKGVTTFMSAAQTIVLRSLLASLNAKDLRDSDDDVSYLATPVQLSATVANAPTTVNICPFGYEKQPFITEIYANTETLSAKKIGLSPPAPGAGDSTTVRDNPITMNQPGVSKNPKGYVLVQLYNPYDTDINIGGWTLGVLTRPATYPTGVTIAPITGFKGFDPSTVVPARSYLVLENMPSSNAGSQTPTPASDATYRPWTVYPGMNGLAPAGKLYYVPNLHEVMNDPATNKPGGELVLLRQLYASATNVNAMSVNPLQNPIPPGTLAHLAPVDSFDFTPLSLPSAANPMQFTAIHYARSNPGNTIPNTAETPLSQPTALMKATFWKFVYPGRWNPGGLYQVPTNVDNTTAAFLARQEGIAVSSWDANGINSSPKAKYTDNWSDYTGAYALGTPQFQGTPSGKAYVQKIAFTTATGTPPLTTPPLAIPFSWQAYGTYPNAFPPIQLNNTDWGGPTKVYTTAANPPGNMFPFGGFARVGDVLQVPYIGSYTIFDSTGNNLIEMNSITRDAALADDTDGPGSAAALTPGADDPVEQIGRFCPLLATQQPLSATGSYSGTPPESYIPLANPANPAAQPGFDPYAWAAHIFDYFSTLQNPQDDYLPNTDPQLYVSATGAWNPATAAWVANPALVPAFAILNSATGFANQASVEDIAPVEGLINVNTASMQTLSAVPFLPGDMPKIGGANVLAPVGTNPGSNQGIAASIITYRNTYGPIKTLFDLNRVLLTQGTYQKTGNPAATPTTFQNFYGDPTLYDYDNYNGSLSPLGTNYSGVTNDFKSRFNMLTRVSNLLTTRSDTYTVYILVQGWTGVGTTAPQMVAQRRAAFIADRSRVTGTNRTLAIYPIQTN